MANADIEEMGKKINRSKEKYYANNTGNIKI